MTLIDLSLIPWYVWVALSTFLFFSGLGILMAGCGIAGKVDHRRGDR